MTNDRNSVKNESGIILHKMGIFRKGVNTSYYTTSDFNGDMKRGKNCIPL